LDGSFHVGRWRVEPSLNTIHAGETVVRLEPKVMQVLVCLADSPGQVLSKDHLIRQVWADTFVGDEALKRCISELRKAFGDDAREPRIIQTIPKGGYRLLAPVAEAPAAPAGGDGRNGGAAVSAETAAPPFASLADANRARATLRIPIGPRTLGLVTVTAVALLALLASRFWGNPHAAPAHTVGTASTGRVMLAVLPFENLSSNQEQDYFCDGLTAEMISQLGSLSPERLGVIDWLSASDYKNTKKSGDVIGRELGVSYLVQGTIRRAGDRVRITAELVSANNHSHLWGNSYEGDLRDVFTLQSNVARSIASEIQVRLTPQQEARLSSPQPVNPKAHDVLLEGMQLAERPSMPAVRGSIKKFDESIQADPNYAEAHAKKAYSYVVLAMHNSATPAEAYPRARAAAEDALRLEAENAAAHHVLGWIAWRYDWDYAAAEKEVRRAIQNSPNVALYHETYALFLRSMGRFDEALREAKRTVELSPRSEVSHANLGTLLFLMHHYDEGMDSFRRAIELNPGLAYVHQRMGAALAGAGRYEGALQALQRAADIEKDDPEITAWMGFTYAQMGRRSTAIRLLEDLENLATRRPVPSQWPALISIGLVHDAHPHRREDAFKFLGFAVDAHENWMVYLDVDPVFAPVRSDPRFEQLRRRLHLPERPISQRPA